MRHSSLTKSSLSLACRALGVFASFILVFGATSPLPVQAQGYELPRLVEPDRLDRPSQSAVRPMVTEGAAPSEANMAEAEKPAQRRVAQKKKKAPAQETAAGYFVEFRARTALSYGHTFVVHGRLNSRGKIISSEVAGLHPAGDDVLPWMVGHIFPVRSETGASDGDTEDQYISARYRINLNAEQYARVSGFIKNLQANSPMWHAVWYNCSAFVADIGRNMGLQSPSSLEFPADFINGMRRMNGGRSTLSDQQAYVAPTAESAR